MKNILLNHSDICLLLYHGNTPDAVEMFYNKTKGVPFTPFTRRCYLSSLNFSIYNYILFKEGISLHESCLENEKAIAHATNDSVLTVGADIIRSYGLDGRYLIEKYHNIHVKNALYYIHSHLSEPLTLEAVSTAANIHPSYLCQLFKKEVHMSFCDYLLSQRIKLARNLLKDTDYSIQEIAERCGFKNASYFSTCYRKATGQVPSKTRQ